MKKTLALAGLLCLALSSVQMAAQAQDWFVRYDTDHDNHWTYNEFASANRDWASRHTTEKILNDVELHKQFSTWDPDNRGYVVRESVSTYHDW